MLSGHIFIDERVLFVAGLLTLISLTIMLHSNIVLLKLDFKCKVILSTSDTRSPLNSVRSRGFLYKEADL